MVRQPRRFRVRRRHVYAVWSDHLPRTHTSVRAALRPDVRLVVRSWLAARSMLVLSRTAPGTIPARSSSRSLRRRRGRKVRSRRDAFGDDVLAAHNRLHAHPNVWLPQERRTARGHVCRHLNQERSEIDGAGGRRRACKALEIKVRGATAKRDTSDIFDGAGNDRLSIPSSHDTYLVAKTQRRRRCAAHRYADDLQFVAGDS